ncbi:uncharacterized protein LOC115607318 [Strigops habroptila]|uniref:uncharacterized protein LOC115607318 n=1 Tax=Strigops habroptila TaxID=2489341 RepID=UPI0011CFD0E7|nr:uncharacterized protein LOC115607318 [Strigops habroptila]
MCSHHRLRSQPHHAQPTSTSPPPWVPPPSPNDSPHIHRATTALLTHLGNTSCHPREDTRCRKPSVDPQGCPQAGAEPSEGAGTTRDAFPALTQGLRRALPCETHTVVFVPPKHHFGRSPEGSQPGHRSTRSQGENKQEPVATRAFVKPNVLTSKGRHRAPSKVAGIKHTPQHLPALTSTKPSGVTHGAPPGMPTPGLGGCSRVASPLGCWNSHGGARTTMLRLLLQPHVSRGWWEWGTHTHWNFAGIQQLQQQQQSTGRFQAPSLAYPRGEVQIQRVPPPTLHPRTWGARTGGGPGSPPLPPVTSPG